ncbi:tetratricopeptide repeat protein [Lujinxingia vulgaris]|nr:tetratricopeptide repeat protein [Lujinxingia vulgaris]
MMKFLLHHRSHSTALLLAALLLAGCAHDLQRGEEALRAGDAALAERIAHEELGNDMANPRANLVLAEALVAQDKHQQALRPATVAEQSGEFGARASLLVARINEALNEPAEAALAYLRARNEDATAVDDAKLAEVLEAGITHAEVRQQLATLIRLRGALRLINADHPAASLERLRADALVYADELVARGEYVDAVDLLEGTLAEDPDFEAGAAQLGSLYLRLDLPDEALRVWRDAASQAPDDAERSRRLASYAERASEFDAHTAAIELLDEAIALLPPPHPDLASLYARQARAYLSAEQPSRAETALRASLDNLASEPTAADYTRLARLATDYGAPQIALSLLLDASESVQLDWPMTELLANLLASRARLDEVEALINRFVEANPPAHVALERAANWAQQRNNLPLARSLYERALQFPETSDNANLALGIVLMELKEREAMLQAFMAYLQAVDMETSSVLQITELLTRERFFEEAERLLKRLGSAAREEIRVVETLAGLYATWGRPADAEATYDAWIASRGNQEEDLRFVAERFWRLGDPGRALSYYERSARAGNYRSWLNVADINFEQGRFPAMSESLERYVANSTPGQEENALADALMRYRRANLPDRVESTLKTLLEAAPDDWRWVEQLSDLYFDTGRDERAITILAQYMSVTDIPAQAFEGILARLSARQRASAALPLARQIFGDRDDYVSNRVFGDVYDAMSREASSDDATELRRRAAHHYRRALERAQKAPEGWSEQADALLRDWIRQADFWRQRRYFEVAKLAYERAIAQGNSPASVAIPYAETLLELGELERAETVLEQLHRDRSRSTRDAVRIAEVLMKYGHYEAAEPYLNLLFASPDADANRQGFTLLATMYRQQDRLDELGPLIDSYLAKAPNTLIARQLILSTLESAGMWDEAIAQLERIASMTPGEHTYLIALNHFRAGRSEKASELLTQWATESAQTEMWLAASDVLANHGELDRALELLDAGVQRAPGDRTLRLQRATLRARAGLLEDALDDANVCLGEREECPGELIASFIEEVSVAGRFDLAAPFMEQARVSPARNAAQTPGRTHPALLSGDPDQVRTFVDEVLGQGVGLTELVNQLDTAGYHALSQAMIEEEIQEGDAATGALLLLNRQLAITPGAAVDDLLMTLRPVVDPLERSNEDFVGPVGDTLMRMGRRDEAIAYLRAAVDAGDVSYLGQLAQALILKGQFEEGMDLLIRSVELPGANTESAANAAMRLELAAQPELARRLLQELAGQPETTAQAFPLKTHYDLEHHGDVRQALADVDAHLEWMRQLRGADFGDALSSNAIEDAIVGALETIASLGYIDAVLAHLDTLPGELRESPRLGRLRLHAALLRGDDEAIDGAVDALLTAANNAPEARRQITLQLLAFGHTARAETVLAPLWETRASDRENVALQLALLRAQNAPDAAITDAAEAHINASADRQLARTLVSELLTDLALDDLALEVARRGAAQIPVASELNLALNAALIDGDLDTLRALLPQMVRTADQPETVLENLYRRSRFSPDIRVPLAILDHLQAIRPAAISWELERIYLRFRNGDVAQARERMMAMVERTGAHPSVVDALLAMLNNERLDVEIARVLATELNPDTLGPLHLRAIAEAELALGFEDRAQPWLHRLDALAGDPAHRVAIATDLNSRRLYTAALQALGEPQPENSPAYDAAHAIATMGSGEPAADAFLNAMRRGIPSISALHDALVAAIDGDLPDDARLLMETLTQTPMAPAYAATQPLQLVLTAGSLDRSGRGMQYVRDFLDTRLPRIASSAGINWQQFAGQLAEAYRHDDALAAYGVYRDRIFQSLLTSPRRENLAIYLNNLAYMYATTDQHIDEGLELARRAIALAGGRNSSYVDTLGWLYFRQGELDQARDTISRALNLYDGSTLGLEELYRHLGEILDAQGQHHSAAWMHIYADRVGQRSPWQGAP